MNGNSLFRMRRWVSIALLLALVAGLLPVFEVSAQAGSVAAVDTGKLNVRSGPGVTFTILNKVPYNTVVTLVGKASTGTWVQIRLGDNSLGWVNSLYLRTYADLSILPVTYDTSVVVPPQTVPPPGSNNPGGPQYYVVKTGDTLKTIAARFGTTWQTLAALNNIANANYIFVGQQLLISGTVPSYPQPQPVPNTSNVYIVQPGDTLFTIAVKFNRTVAALMTANNIYNANLVYSGQRLVIPAPPPPPRYYTVQPGDTLFSIAVRFGSSVPVISAANNIFNPNSIYTGQTLTIP